MKIAIIADPLDNQRAGVHVYLRELVKALAENPDEYEYILIRERVDPDLPLPQIAVPNIHLPIGYASFRLFFIIPWIIRRLGVDAVFEPAHFGPFNLPKRIKRVTMIHDLTPILFPQFHRWHSQLLQKVFLPGILKRTNLVISNSLNTASDLARVYPFTTPKTKTIHLGTPSGFFPDERKDFLKHFKIESPYFVYVGTIEPRKQVPQLLEAYTRFREEHSERVLLVLVGQIGWKSGPFAEALAIHPYKADILLTGYIKKEWLPQAYYHALSLVYPSLYEGFGFPIIEAMSCGTGVVCPDNSSLPEVGGELAQYYETSDLVALTGVLLTVARAGMPGEVKRQAYVEWARRFTWRTYVQQFRLALRGLSS